MKTKIAAVLFLLAIIGLTAVVILSRERGGTVSEKTNTTPHLAQFFEKLGDGMVQCSLCPKRCTLSEGQIGACRARKNIGGELYSLVYGNVASVHVDPIEKKPLFHFLPGSSAYSIATTGCNLRCKFCQNWEISQAFPWEVESVAMTPERVVDAALASGAKSIAYTYNEPTIYIEYLMDIARIAHEHGLKNVVISAGLINSEPLKQLLPLIDAYKIDFKGFDESFYRKMTMGRLGPVLEAMKIIKASGVWLEIVNLVIPSENDSEENLRNLIVWVRDNLGADTPLHFTRFHPDYKLQNLPPTPVETLKKARTMALGLGMKYVYTGNAFDPEGETTFCPTSHQPAIERQGFIVTSNNLSAGRCPDGEQIPGVWE